ncbi:MAG: cytochrome c [Vicinamibacterales bacterium]
MTRPVFAALAVVGLAAGSAHAQRIDTVPMTRTAASDGATMYQSYCVSCHGLDATGNGPAAKALTKAPADLTRISARNNGQFPEVRVKRYIEGADEIAAHGTRDMPVWSTLFRSLEPDLVPLRVQALADFLKSVQR